MTVFIWFIAFILDLKLGDPCNWPHPVRWIGRLISETETVIRHWCKSETALKLGGMMLWVIVVGGTWLLSYQLLRLAFAVQFLVGVCG